MKALFISKALEIAETVNAEDTDVHVFTQFFVHKNKSRNEEIRYCLAQNYANPHIDHIHLLNERIYTDEEMGLAAPVSDKVRQEVIGKRLTFQSVFQYIREQGLKGYFVLLNADIFLDDSVRFLRASTMHLKKQALALLRYEFNPTTAPMETAPLFGPRFDSQDTWILHSQFPIKLAQEKLFAFDFGRPGCDNKFVYLMRVLGYDVVNDPELIRTYHYHRSIMRDYFGKEVLPQPWGGLVPYGVATLAIPPSIGINIMDVCRTTQGFQYMMFEDHELLYNYVGSKLAAGQPFIIPRVAGIENNFAVFARLKQQTPGRTDLDAYFNQVGPAMKSNAGVLLTSWASIQRYSDLYLKAFDNCEVYSGWDVQGEVYKHIAQSHEYVRNAYPAKRPFWAFALDVFHYVYDPQAWTKALQGRRVLIVSPFIDSIRERVPKRAKLYDGVDLFPGCTFEYIMPPVTQAGEPSREFDVELADFYRRLDQLKDKYDIALVSCGGYGNLVCNYIFETHRKSAVYVGGVLQMYFGVLGGRWLKERADVVRLFLNEHWARPKLTERPKDCDAVESGCYW